MAVDEPNPHLQGLVPSEHSHDCLTSHFCVQCHAGGLFNFKSENGITAKPKSTSRTLPPTEPHLSGLRF